MLRYSQQSKCHICKDLNMDQTALVSFSYLRKISLRHVQSRVGNAAANVSDPRRRTAAEASVSPSRAGGCSRRYG